MVLGTEVEGEEGSAVDVESGRAARRRGRLARRRRAGRQVQLIVLLGRRGCWVGGQQPSTTPSKNAAFLRGERFADTKCLRNV